MFGTLVVQLPSDYSGGELVVYHQSDSTRFDFSGPDGFNDFHFAAFYSDCRHEIKPVTRGHRLCLVYDLIYRGFGDCPAPESNEDVVSSLVSAMKEWSVDAVSDECPPIMCYMLEHEYSEAHLSFELLKHNDREMARVLQEAQKKVEFDLYVGQVEVTENWSADHVCDRYWKWGCMLEEDHTYEQIEKISENCVSKNPISPDGHSILGVCFERKYLVPEYFFDEIDPAREDFLEIAMGDKGPMVEKEYSATALLFWPTSKRVINIGVDNMVTTLAESLAAPSADRDGLAEVARSILRVSKCSMTDSSAVSFLQCLLQIGDAGLISDGLKFVSDHSSGSLILKASFGEKVVAIGSAHGWGMLKSPLETIFARLSATDREIVNYCDFLRSISGSQPSDTQKDVCQSLADCIFRVIAKANSLSWHSYWSNDSYKPFKPLLQSLVKLGDARLIAEGLKFIFTSSSAALLSRAHFSDEIISMSRTCGWSVLKAPLEAIVKKVCAQAEGIVDCCKFLEHISSSQPSDEQKDACQCLTSAIISALSDANAQSWPRCGYASTDSYDSLIESLLKIGNASLITEGLKLALNSSSRSQLIDRASFVEKILSIGSTYEWDVLKDPFECLVAKLPKTSGELIEYCKFLQRISGSVPHTPSPPLSAVQKDICRALASAIVAALSAEKDAIWFCTTERILFPLVRSLITLEDDSTLLCLVKAVVVQPYRYPVRLALAPLCEKLYKGGNEAFELLRTHCISSLKAATDKKHIRRGCEKEVARERKAAVRRLRKLHRVSSQQASDSDSDYHIRDLFSGEEGANEHSAISEPAERQGAVESHSSEFVPADAEQSVSPALPSTDQAQDSRSADGAPAGKRQKISHADASLPSSITT